MTSNIDKTFQKIKDTTSDYLAKIYHEIDAECISETDTVKMETIKKVLIKYGAKAQDLE